MRHNKKMARLVGRRIEAGRMTKITICRVRTHRMSKSRKVFGFVGLKIDERTSYVWGTRNPGN